MTEPVQQALSTALLRTLMQEAAAVPLHAVREMQEEFIQAQAAMTQQSLAVSRTGLASCSGPELREAARRLAVTTVRR